MKWFWEAKKGLEPLTLMADVSLAAMAGVTAADHERISKIVLDHLRVWSCLVTSTYASNRHRLRTRPARLITSQSLGLYNALCL